ncbi:MAG: hydroxymethylglutaryl-CoA synthase [Candidatus Methanomethylicia archaeon]|nr:hydroxymethylglutaryl-CoA synthase [Candidatus Methanomethylicia archaeon]
MSSEPIEKRVSYISDKLRGSICPICGKKYFKLRYYCPACGRKSMGKMMETNYLYCKGVLEVCTIVDDDATNRFKVLKPFVLGIVSIEDGEIKIPARLTDYIPNSEFKPEDLEGREVVFRFRRRYAAEVHEIVPTTSLTFTFTDEYYPYIPYKVEEPKEISSKPGIVGYAIYTSRFRIREEDMERSVPFVDEDSITAAVEAGKMALIQTRLDGNKIKKIYIGTESNPYSVKPIASKVSQVLDLGENIGDGVRGIDAIDTEFACKAATSMFKDAIALSKYMADKGEEFFTMVMGTDNSQAAPRDQPGGELDYFVGYGATAFIIGNTDVIAEVEGWYSVTSDTPDFWRRDGQKYPLHGGRFTGEPSYFKHTIKAAKKLMDKMGLTAKDIEYFIPHQPNVKFPLRAARRLGFREEQCLPSLKVGKFGNLYSGSSPAGLVAVLEIAKPYEKILLTSFGSGAGSDAYLFTVTPKIVEKRKRLEKFNIEWQCSNPYLIYIDYNTYRRFKEGI